MFCSWVCAHGSVLSPPPKLRLFADSWVDLKKLEVILMQKSEICLILAPSSGHLEFTLRNELF